MDKKLLKKLEVKPLSSLEQDVKMYEEIVRKYTENTAFIASIHTDCKNTLKAHQIKLKEAKEKLKKEVGQQLKPEKGLQP